MSLGVKAGLKKWFPRDKAVFRLDVDAAVNEELNRFGVGAVIRDHEGVSRGALAKKTLSPSTVLEAEINAILYGVGLCLQEELTPFVVYSNSLLAIRLLGNDKGGELYIENELSPLVEVIKTGVLLGFKHMCREANSVAHNLAQFGAGCDGFCIWNKDFPPWLSE